MSVETRRFRTWEGTGHADAPWRVILHYSIQRMLRAWHLRLLLVVVLIGAIGFLGGHAYDMTDEPAGASYGTVAGAGGTAIVISGLFLVFVAAPLFSEDIRFNAPLFYFSRPVTAKDYVLGKAAYVAGVLAVMVLVPLLFFLVLTLVGAVLAEVPDWVPAQEVAEFERTRVDGVGDWLVATAILLPGVLAFLVFLSSLFVAMSAWTRRGWHAAVGGVVAFGGWSILGLTVSDATRTAVGDCFGPIGWISVMVFYPLEERFGWRYGAAQPEHLERLGIAIPLAYTAVIASSIGLWALTHFRLRRLEGIL